MSHKTTRRACLGMLAASALGLATGAQAQSWPSKTITIVVPYQAGGATDKVARLLGEKLAPRLGKPVIVDNKGGAGGIIGVDAVAKAAPDGHTLVLGLSSSLLINQFLFKKLPFLMSLKALVETGKGQPTPDDVKIDNWN